MPTTTQKTRKPRAKETKIYNVKQVLHISVAMDNRLQQYVKDKGIKAPAVCITALNDFLTANGL